MHAQELLHTLFDDSCKIIDKRIRCTLFETAETLLIHKRLSVVSLGRVLNRKAKVKNNIKCVDRLFGNTVLHKKSHIIYKTIAHTLLRGNRRPIIIIDWSGLTRCGAYHFLRASIAVGGRALTVYDEVHALDEYGSDQTHRQFLKTLQTILPDNCKPIIITDAGFRNTWFKTVLAMGWDFIGRVRHVTQYQEKPNNNWQPIKTLYVNATKNASYIGQVLLAKTNPLACHFYLMKKNKMNRIKKNLAGKKIQCSVSKKHEQRENEPWLIASSLSPEIVNAYHIMQLYKKRMQIEEAFRDLKNSRQGFSLRHCRSFSVKRLHIALLIASLAMLVLWLFGVATKQRKLHFEFQTNTIKNRNVLSNFMIGWQVLICNKILFRKQDILSALKQVITDAHWSVI